MGKTPDISQDEQGFLTLDLPQPASFRRSLPSWLHGPALHSLVKRISKRHIVLISALAANTIWLFFVVSFFAPSNLAFSTASETCGFNPMVLPKINKHRASQSFVPESKGGLSLFGYPLLTTKTCLNATAPPVGGQSESASIALLHIPFLQKKISITPDNPPLASARFDSAAAISATGQLQFDLDQADQIFGYELSGNDKSTACSTSNTVILCDLPQLELAQGTAYDITLNRMFNGSFQEEILAVSIKTLDPVIIASTSIKDKATVYNAPSSLGLTTNKPLVSIEGIQLLRGKDVVDGVNGSFDNKTLTIKFSKALERESGYTLKIAQLTAADGSQLVKPFELSFVTSGGPKVVGSSIGGSRVQPWSSVTLSFDVDLKSDQNASKLARIEVAGRAIPASVSLSGNRLTINPSSSLPRCTAFKVVLGKGLINKFDIGGGEAWSQNSRTICQVAFSIGRSVQGRQITAYRFGSGSSRIVLVGGMHGNERSSVHTLNAFINYLEDRAGEIPGGRSIIVIPNSNPDGYARGSRTNANGVDLNRNFPANDWQSSVQMPGGITSPTGGGNSAGDQPETQALMNYINSNNPRLVLTYHAVARVVISNDAGDSSSLGQRYASDAGYRFTTDAGSDDEFGYATTGEFEDWLADKKGEPGILIELAYMNSSEFNTHRAAMWNMVRLP